MTSFEVGTRKMLCGLQDDAPVSVTEIATSPQRSKEARRRARSARDSRCLQSWIRLLPGHCRHPIDESDRQCNMGQTASCSVRGPHGHRSLRTPSASCVEEPTTGLRLTATEAQGRGATSTHRTPPRQGPHAVDGCRSSWSRDRSPPMRSRS